MKIEHKIAKALESASKLQGIVCTADFKHELGTEAKYIDDYLALGVLAELFKGNKAEIIFKVSREDKKMEYLLRLLTEGRNRNG